MEDFECLTKDCFLKLGCSGEVKFNNTKTDDDVKYSQ